MISFRNSPFSISGNGNQVIFSCTQVSFEESAEFQRVGDLGYNSVGIAQTSRPEGSFTAECYVDSEFLNIFNFTGFVGFKGGVDGAFFNSGFLTEISIEVSPISPLTASVRGVFYETLNRSSYPVIFQNINDIAHGAYSYLETGSPLLLNENLLSISLSFSQNFTPYYKLGSYDLLGLNYDGGEVRCSINGTGLQKAVDFGCNPNTDLVLTLKNVCNIPVGNLGVSGLKVTSSSFEVNKDDDVVGSMELIGYY